MNSFVRTLLLFTLILLSHSAIAALSEKEKQEVVVTSRNNLGVEFVMTVDLGNRRYRFVTMQPEYNVGEPNAASKLPTFRWRGDYLFVRQLCASFGKWRCIVDQVFTRNGKSLLHVGAVESSGCDSPGCGYDEKHGLFADIYDGLETNPVSGQTDSPPLRIARRNIEGTFKTDIDASWELNQPAYLASIACLEKVAKSGFSEPCNMKWEAWSALVFAAKLTHFAGRKNERARLFDELALPYCANSVDPNCTKRVAGVKDHFSRFPVGDAPKFTPYPVVIMSANTPEPKPALPEKFSPGKALPLKQ